MLSEFKIKKNTFNEKWELQIKVDRDYRINKQVLFFKTKSKLIDFLNDELEKIDY